MFGNYFFCRCLYYAQSVQILIKMRKAVFIFFLITTNLFSQENNGDNFMNKPPIFPGCGVFIGKEPKKICFKDKLNMHIRKNFKYPKIALDSGYQGRVIVKFVLNKYGIVENISANGPYSFFEEEAIRIISKLPKIKPAKNKSGKPISVPFSTSITFRLK